MYVGAGNTFYDDANMPFLSEGPRRRAVAVTGRAVSI
jgi:hypothetical protein